MLNGPQKTGIITGLAIVAWLVIFYLIDRSLAVNPFVTWGTLLVAGFGMAAAVRAERRAGGDRISKREALRTAFLVYVLAMLCYFVFYYVLLNYIDPSLIELQKQAMIEAGRSVEGIDFSMTLGKAVSGYVISLLGGFLIAYLMASVMKRER